MDADTYSNAGVIEYSNKTFVNVGIFLDKESPVAEKFKIEAIPTTLLLTPEGERIATWVGYVKAAPYKQGLEKALAAHKKLLDLAPKLKASPEDLALLTEAAGLYEELGDARKAAEALVKASTKAAAGKPQADLLVKAFRLLNDEDADEGINKSLLDIADRMEKIDSDGKLGLQDDALYARAMVDFNKQAWDEAIKKLEGIVAKWPDGDKAPEAMVVLASILHEAKENHAMAMKVLQEMIAKYPKSEFVDRAKEMLEHIKKHAEKK